MPSLREKLAGKKTKLATAGQGPGPRPAGVNGFEDGVFLYVPISEIRPNPDQPRQYFDPNSLAELAESIKEKGVLQPVIVRRGEDGGVILVAGERRVRAARLAGLERIPAVVTRGNQAEIALIENLQREDLRPIEEAEALQRMIEEYGYTHEGLAKVLGKARSTVTETLSLCRLPESIKEECRGKDTYPRRLLVEIAKLETEEEMLEVFRQVKEGKLDSESVRKISRSRGRLRSSQGSEMVLILRKVRKRLEGLSLEELPDGQRVEVLEEIGRLREILDAILKDVGAPTSRSDVLHRPGPSDG
jgi:ParB family chromosome partitioning protein